MKYRNTGAPFRRADGTVWARDDVAEPTEDELRRRKYKLRAVGEERPEMFGWARDAAEPSVGQPSAEWPLRMTPEMYLRMHPDGQYAETARKLVGEGEVITPSLSGEGGEDGAEVVEEDSNGGSDE